MEFNQIRWHDSVIKNIVIDRNCPGKKDIIKLEIEWNSSKKGGLIFEDVYWSRMNFNFGIVADETIMDASALSADDEDLLKLYLNWKETLNDVRLTAYKINLNSTGNEIKIISKSFKVY